MDSPPRLDHRPDLQGLRAIAILFVVLTHAGAPILPGGFVGVDVFFVLSGYLMTALLLKEYAGSGRIDLPRFLARRLRRLLPAMLVMLAAIVAISLMLLSPYEAWQRTTSLLAASTWTANLFFAWSSMDYFAQMKTQDLFLHTWSLGLEAQFYLIWPAVLLSFFALRGIRRTAAIDSNLRGKGLTALGLLALSSLGLSWYWSTTEALWSFYLMPARLWEFALGAAALQLPQQEALASRLGKWSGSLRRIGLGLILVSAALITPDISYPGFAALLPATGAFLVIASGGLPDSQQGSSGLASAALVWLGDRSYSWYLWHWPVLMLGYALGTRHRALETAALVGLSLLLAMLSYRYVETPLWKGKLSHVEPAKTILVSLVSMLLCASLALTAHRGSDGQDRAVDSIAARARVDLPPIYGLGCDAWYTDSVLRPCLFGNAAAARTVVLLGDSIGAQWFSLLPEIFTQPGWRIVVLTKSSCPMVDEDIFYPRIGKIYQVCSEWRGAALAYLDRLRPQLVFVGSSADYRYSDRQWREGSARVVKRLAASASHVVVIAGNPALSFDGPACLERRASSARHSTATNAVCSEAPANSPSAKASILLAQAVQAAPNARLLDLNDLICPEGLCAAMDAQGRVVFRDEQHLTSSYVRALAPKVGERLLALGLGQALRP